MDIGKLEDIRMREPEKDEYAITMDIWELEELDEVLGQVVEYAGMFNTNKIEDVQQMIRRFVKELSA